MGYQEETAAKATALHEMNASHEELKGQNQYIADKLSRLEVPPRPSTASVEYSEYPCPASSF